MAVDHDRVAAECLDPPAVGVQAPAKLGLAALPEPVDVPDRGQVRQLVVTGFVERLPDRALSQLGVAAQHPHVVGQVVEVLSRQCHADADREALAKRARGDVDPGNDRGRVTLEARAELAEGHHLGVGDGAGGLEHRVAKRRRVAFGVDQVVVVRVFGLAPVVLQVAGQEDGDEIRGRHRGGRVAGAGRRAAADGVHPELLAELACELEICGRNRLGDGHVTPRHQWCEGPLSGGFAWIYT